jgi:thermitase
MPAKENTFLHPTHGRCKVDGTKAAIRWIDDVSPDTQSRLLKSLGLSLVQPPPPRNIKRGQRNVTEINNTSGLSWVESGRKTIPPKTLDTLEKSDLVQWVSPAFRQEKAPEFEGLFAINPKRLYLASAAATALGDLTNLEGLSVDTGRTERLHGTICLNVEQGTALEATKRLGAMLKERGAGGAAGVRLENIPLISPGTSCSSCESTEVSCNAAASEFLPNDSLFPIAWGLRRINAPYAWSITRGEPSIVVAVLDQGVELAHPDLTVFPQSWNTSTDIADGSPTGNHGTACAGIVAATINNSLGATGVAGNCQVMAIATATWADIDIAEGLYFAADNGARVVSMSFGVYPSWGFWDFSIIRDALQYANDKGLVLVAASGNENGAESRFPGSDSRTICVGGSNRDDQRKRIGDASSEAWWGASYGPDLDVVGPCLEIPTTDRLGAFGYSATDYYNFFNGTSSATPHVAGLAALILSIRPDLANEQVREIIETTCDKISPSLYTYSLVASKPNGPWNEETGYGRINVERAILVACEHGKPTKQPCACPDLCLDEIPKECIAPPAPPWMPFDQCIYWYEPRFIGDRDIQIRIVYEHCLRLLGRQQGPLLYTTTLLPGESVRLFHYDRYRRVRSETQRLSVHSSFRQTVSALWQARQTRSESKYQDVLIQVRSDDDANITIGGQLFPFSFNIDDPDLFVSDAQGASINTVSDQFQQTVVTASQQVDAERSLVISNFEEAENQNTTSRTIVNHNHCRAVTYFVRRVLEVYQLHTFVKEINWRVRGENDRQFGEFRSIDDLNGVPDQIVKRLKELLKNAPRVGAEVRAAIRITVPTDGALYEAELAHCSSCEPERQFEVEVALEKARNEARKLCLEAEILAIEVERRKALLCKGELDPFETSAPALLSP